MKQSELLKLLKKEGFTLKRHGSRHDIYTKNGIDVAVPRHAKELKTGTADKILKDAGLK